MLAMAIDLSEFDRDKCIQMCLVHDMAESVVGDITPADNVPKSEKSHRESKTMAHIKDKLFATSRPRKECEKMFDLWKEFESGTTKESILVQDLDKVEMLLQMEEYETRAGGKINLNEFTYVTERLRLPMTQKIAERIVARQSQFWAGIKEKGEDAPEKTTREQQDRYYGAE